MVFMDSAPRPAYGGDMVGVEMVGKWGGWGLAGETEGS